MSCLWKRLKQWFRRPRPWVYFSCLLAMQVFLVIAIDCCVTIIFNKLWWWRNVFCFWALPEGCNAEQKKRLNLRRGTKWLPWPAGVCTFSASERVAACCSWFSCLSCSEKQLEAFCRSTMHVSGIPWCRLVAQSIPFFLCTSVCLFPFLAFSLSCLPSVLMPNSPFQVPCASCGCFLELLALVGTGTRMSRLNRLI